MLCPAVDIQLSHAGNVATITLNRPETRNALTSEMIGDLAKAIQSLPRQRRGGAVLLTGAGDAFCAGADVKIFVEQLENGGPEGLSQHIREVANELHREVVLGLLRLEKPVVAAINGVAAGAGFSLTLACDVRIAASSARFLMAYANIGATADGGSSYLLPRLLGAGKAMEIYLAAQPMSAEVALQTGLVSQVCDKDKLGQHALEIASRLAQGPTVAYGRVKSLFQRSWDAGIEDQLDAETREIGDIALTRDFQEGISAFTAKRQPWFQGI